MVSWPLPPPASLSLSPPPAKLKPTKAELQLRVAVITLQQSIKMFEKGLENRV